MSTAMLAKDAHILAQQINGYYDQFLPKISEIIKSEAEKGHFSVNLRHSQVIDVELNRSARLTIEQGLERRLESLGYRVSHEIGYSESMRTGTDEYLFTVSWMDL